jgi:hypothetical protein
VLQQVRRAFRLCKLVRCVNFDPFFVYGVENSVGLSSGLSGNKDAVIPCKLVFLGASGVGKSSILGKYVKDQFNPDVAEPTIGSVSFFQPSKSVEFCLNYRFVYLHMNYNEILTFWGQSRFGPPFATRTRSLQRVFPQILSVCRVLFRSPLLFQIASQQHLELEI